MVTERESLAPLWRDVAVGMLVAATMYFAMARLGLELAVPPAFKASPVWPASGVALAAVMFWGRAVWPGIWCGAFMGNVIDFYFGPAQYSFAAHILIGATIATGSTLQALVGSHLIDQVISKNNPLGRGWDIIRFFVLVCFACLIAASLGVGSLVVAGITPLANAGFSWVTWWLGDCVGIVVVTPFLLVWLRPRDRTKFPWTEATMMLLIIAAVALLAFTSRHSNNALAASLAFLAAPLIVIATFRFGQRGATASLLVFAGVAVWGTASGLGPFVYNSTNESLLSLQAFVGILSLTALSLAAVLEERRNEETLKTQAIDELQQVLTEISTLRSMIPLCAWCKKVRNDTGAWEQLERYIQRSYAASFSHGICPECKENIYERSDDELRDDG